MFIYVYGASGPESSMGSMSRFYPKKEHYENWDEVHALAREKGEAFLYQEYHIIGLVIYVNID